MLIFVYTFLEYLNCIILHNSFTRLLHPDFNLLQLIGKAFPFEITVGLNGRIWMNSREVMNTITLSNAIVNSEFLSNDEIKSYATRLLNEMQGF